MKEVLDEIEIKNKQKKYSKLSLMTSIATCGLFFYLVLSMPSTIKAKEGIPEPSMIIRQVILLFCLSGIVVTTLSILKKEPATWFKWLGGTLNILFFLFILGTNIHAIIIRSIY